VAAIRAAQLGLKTALVEKDPQPGGTCLHWGCIPTKALLHSAEVLESARGAAKFGVTVGDVGLDMAAVHVYKDAVVQKNAKGVEFLLKKNRVESIRGFGRLRGRGQVEVKDAAGQTTTVRAKNIILATGSAVRSLPGIDLDGTTILSSDDALHLKAVPASMIVLGGGAVGVEFASVYSRFGSQVTIVELLPHLLPVEDQDVSAELERCFRKRKIAVHTATAVQSVKKTATGVEIVARQGEKEIRLSAEKLLVAVGRKPRTEGIGLEGTGVKLEKGFVVVDGLQRTGEPGVYAIGDIVPTPALAHVASHEGVIAAEQIAGRNPHPLDRDQIPGCTYCDPEVASVGLTEAEARRRGHDVKTGKFPFSALGKASILQANEGFVKIVSEAKYDQVLGVHLIGPHVTDLVSEAGAALRLETTTEELFAAVHPHPTLSEAVSEAALALHGRPIHIFLEAARAAAASSASAAVPAAVAAQPASAAKPASAGKPAPGAGA
jgi:dihydrolipoamide dehydrogenase